MNIKEFLIDNYIWIIVIILITIITIIGFLADKKKSSKKNDAVPAQNPNNVNNQQVNNVGQMQYNGFNQQIPNQMDNSMNQATISNDANNQIPQQMNSNVTQQNLGNFNNNINQISQEQPMQMNFQASNDTTNNNPTPVENITNNSMPEPMYQPLSEQKPVIAPHPVPNFSNSLNPNNQPMMNLPVENIQNQNQPVTIPSFEQHQGQQIINPVQPSLNQPQSTSYQIPNQPQQNMINNNSGNVQNFNQPNTTIPEPINNTIPVPKPVMPQPITQGTYTNNQPMQQNNLNQMPQPMQQNQPTPNASISFVYGPQQNNQNM